MKIKVTHIIYTVATVVMITSCKPTVPSKYIQPDEMEDLIYDYHLAQGIASQENSTDYQKRLAFELVLKEHGVSQAEFDSSLVYYYTRADRFQEIYKNVGERLNKESEKYGGAAINAVTMMASASLNGDTADVWAGNRALMLLNDRPYHLYQFSQKADTTFHAGDSFMLSFNTTWLMQNGNRQAVAYLAITYDNDSTTKQYNTISGSGLTTLRIPYCKEKVKEIKGFVVCGMRPAKDDVNKLCLLFIDNIQLYKFRNKVIEHPVVPNNSMPDSIAMRMHKPDSARYDSLHRPPHRMGDRPIPMGDRPHPMGDRPMTVGEMQKMQKLQKMPPMKKMPPMEKMPKNKNVKPISK